MAVGVALFLGGCVVRDGGPGGARPIYVPRGRPVVVQAPPPAETAPAPVYGRPVEAETVPPAIDVPPGQIQSAEVHERNAERKAQHDAAKGKGKRKGKGKAPKQ